VNLGLLYEKGRTAAGVKDPATAATYYQRACDGGRPSGCYNLGRLYERGTGVGLDVTQAKVNYKKACDKGDGDACQALTRLP
jgi:TPR repeat protein